MRRHGHAVADTGAQRRSNARGGDLAEPAGRQRGRAPGSSGTYVFWNPQAEVAVTIDAKPPRDIKLPRSSALGSLPSATESELVDRMRPLTPAEKECKELVYQRLLKVMDLSLISSLPDREARSQIRTICER